MKNDRLFQILYILLKKQMVPAPELAKQLEVSVRTIYRDIDALSAAGVPVYALSGRGGGISLMPGFTLDKSLLSDAEQDQILFALQSLQATDQNVTILLSKLGAVFEKANRNWIEVDFSRWGHRRMDNTKFELLKKSILEKRVLHIRYCNASGVAAERDIKPLKLVFKEKNWYVQGFCLKAEDFRLFKISRIVELFPTKQYFEDEFCNIPELESETLPASEIICLKLKFSPQAAFRVYDEFEVENIEKQSDGSMLATTNFPYSDWIYAYILTFGTQVEILEPLFLKEKLRKYVKSIYEHLKT